MSRSVYRLGSWQVDATVGEEQAAATARDRFALDAGQGLEWRAINERH
jgi:hypothetical protein